MPAVYQVRPSRDASVYLGVNRQIDIPTIGIRRFFTTDIPYPTYRTVITMIRGRAAAAVAVATTPPGLTFLLTDPPLRPRAMPDAGTVFAPPALQYDPLSAGAFLATTVPWLGRYLSADASLLIPSIPPPLPTLPTSLRRFADLLFYQSPHRQEASAFVVTPATFSGVAPVVPLELRRFLVHEWAWRNGPGYPYDASWYGEPQSIIRQPPPPPTAHGGKTPLYFRHRMRRRRHDDD